MGKSSHSLTAEVRALSRDVLGESSHFNSSEGWVNIEMKSPRAPLVCMSVKFALVQSREAYHGKWV